MLEIIFIAVFFIAIAQGIMILSKKSDINYETKLSKANELMEYLDRGYVDGFDGNGNNILMLAASEEPLYLRKKDTNDFIDVMKRALDLGINVNSQSKKGKSTALHYSVHHNSYTKSLELLLNRGADVNIKNSIGRTPLWVVCFVGNYTGYEMLIPIVDNINSQDIDGYSPLMAAAREGHIGIVIDLLDRGANVFLKTKEGKNAYEIANENKSRHYKHCSNSASHETSYAKYNHSLNEMVRRLYCITNGKKYKFRKFVMKSSKADIE